MKKLKIDKDIPIHPENSLGIPVFDMSYGDSVFVPYKIDHSLPEGTIEELKNKMFFRNMIRSHITRMIDKLNDLHELKFTYVETVVDGQNGFRVWRI
jgi:hypothetical protein